MNNMKAAVYYPYLRVQTHGLMKHALLFWDHLEIITPFGNVEPQDDKELAAASEILVKPCIPSESQKEEAHVQLMALVSRPLPPCEEGIRPNSVVHRTTVSSRRPRCFKSWISAAAPRAKPMASGA